MNAALAQVVSWFVEEGESKGWMLANLDSVLISVARSHAGDPDWEALMNLSGEERRRQAETLFDEETKRKESLFN